MKKVIFTLALGLFFVTFTNAQSTVSETADAKAKVVVENKACKPGRAKACCAGKNADAKATKEDNKSCATKGKSCADKKRPDSCKH